jgi:NADH-quinone oxidoreductase subunit J
MIALLLVLVVTVVSAGLAVTMPNIVYGVVFLLCTNITLAIAYYMMGAPTVALFQLAIFAGAVVVFFIITVMFTRAGEMEIVDEPEVSQ